MPNKPEWFKSYTTKQRNNLLKEFGGKCTQCGSETQLEFHHIKPTEMSGHNGRGKYHRIKDIKCNKDCYLLLCCSCHKKVHGHDID